MSTTKKRGRWAAALLILGLTGFLLARWLTPAPPDDSPSPASDDPRRTYRGPYRNIHPDVAYVGDGACIGCHDKIAQSFARHPMGRSLVRVEKLLDRQRYGAETHNPFTVLGRRFQVERRDNRLWHRQTLEDERGRPVVELDQEVGWAIGSGQKGYSYLTEREGYLFQTAVSWFAHEQRWDLSPGFGPSVLAGRMVPASCLFCHANRMREHAEEPDRFVPPLFDGHAIGCERCHGPGELHARGDFDRTIVNPERLTPPLRDAVCEQCHLEGEARIPRAKRGLFDFRPGLPLSDFWAVLVRDRQSGEDAKAVNHVEQMYQSKCFSHPVDGLQLGCITCHDPHVHIGPAEREVYYRNKCLKCHDSPHPNPSPQRGEGQRVRGCSESPAKRKPDNCIACHMPRYSASDIVHTASTDHRIVRRPPRQPIQSADLERAVLVDFYRDRFPDGDPQSERSLGLGLVKMMNEGMLQPQRHAERALSFLELALGRDAEDVSVRQGKVEAYLLLHRPAEALSEAELLVPKRPADWQLFVQAAFAAQAVGRLERAEDYWRKAIRINPFIADYQARFLSLLIRKGQLAEARKHCEQLLRLDPFNVAGRQARVGFLIEDGKREEARREFAVLRQLKPPDLEGLEKWFQQSMKE
jgi:Flp pilus assembly protein TadD